MEDYASAALVGFVRASCVKRGIDLAAPSEGPGGARIQLETKRGLLRHLVDAHGLATVYSIGRDIRHAPFDPILHMLLGASKGAELVERWQRLERYVHSRHRLRTERRAMRDLALVHYSETEEPPDAAEDLLVPGVLVGLLERRGCTGVALRLVQDDAREFDPEELDGSATPRVTALWHLTWKAESTREVVSQPAPLGAAQATPRGLTSRILARIAEDPTRVWSLKSLAEALGLGMRTLQRRLAADGTSLSKAVAAARVREAARLLAETLTPIGLVGQGSAVHQSRDQDEELLRPERIRPRGVDVRGIEVGAGLRPDDPGPVVGPFLVLPERDVVGGADGPEAGSHDVVRRRREGALGERLVAVEVPAAGCDLVVLGQQIGIGGTA